MLKLKPVEHKITQRMAHSLSFFFLMLTLTELFPEALLSSTGAELRCIAGLVCTIMLYFLVSRGLSVGAFDVLEGKG